MADKKLPHLHELIALKSGTQSQAVKTMTDLANTFEKKGHHFTAKIKTFLPDGEGAIPKTEEELQLQTSVGRELAWVREFIAKAIDSSNFVNEGNAIARADVVLEDGTTLIANVTATTLLELEGRIEELRKFAEKIPTLDPAKGFRPDPDKGADVFVAREVEKTRTQASKKVYVLYPATDKHPAQTQLVDEQVPIGKIKEQEWSSMLTPAAKGLVIERIETLGRAVKRARSRANDTSVDVSNKIGDKLLSYAFSGV